jgi:hypothetical protein
VYGLFYEQGRRSAPSNSENHEVSNGIFDGMQKHRQITYAIITPSPSYWPFFGRVDDALGVLLFNGIDGSTST